MSKQGSTYLALALGLIAALGFALPAAAGTITRTLTFFDNSASTHTLVGAESTTVEMRVEIPHDAAAFYAQYTKRAQDQLWGTVLVGWINLPLDSIAGTGTGLPNIVLHKRGASLATADTLASKVSGDSLLFVGASRSQLKIAIYSGVSGGTTSTMAPGTYIRFRLQGGSTPLRARLRQPSVTWFTP